MDDELWCPGHWQKLTGVRGVTLTRAIGIFEKVELWKGAGTMGRCLKHEERLPCSQNGSREWSDDRSPEAGASSCKVSIGATPPKCQTLGHHQPSGRQRSCCHCRTVPGVWKGLWKRWKAPKGHGTHWWSAQCDCPPAWRRTASLHWLVCVWGGHMAIALKASWSCKGWQSADMASFAQLSFRDHPKAQTGCRYSMSYWLLLLWPEPFTWAYDAKCFVLLETSKKMKNNKQGKSKNKQTNKLGSRQRSRLWTLRASGINKLRRLGRSTKSLWVSNRAQFTVFFVLCFVYCFAFCFCFYLILKIFNFPMNEGLSTSETWGILSK